MSKSPPITYIWTDEAPALATHALLPPSAPSPPRLAFPRDARHLRSRHLAAFPDRLSGGAEGRRRPCRARHKLVDTPEANVIKLPKISASILQMKVCISELRDNGHALLVKGNPKPSNGNHCTPGS